MSSVGRSSASSRQSWADRWLLCRGAKGAIIIGIAFTTFISWIPGHGASYLGNTSDLPGEAMQCTPARYESPCVIHPSAWNVLCSCAAQLCSMSRHIAGGASLLMSTGFHQRPHARSSSLGAPASTGCHAGGIGNDGDSRWSYFRKVVAAPSLTNVAGQFDFGGLGTGDVWKALIIFLYVRLLLLGALADT